MALLESRAGNDPGWVQEWADAIVDAVKNDARYKV